MAPLLTLLAHETLSRTVAKAVREGDRILAAFGVPGPYRRVRVAQTRANGASALDVFVVAANGKGYDFGVCGCESVPRFERVQRVGDWNLHVTELHPKGGAAPKGQLSRTTAGIVRLQPVHALLPGWVDPWGGSDRISVPSGAEGYPFLEGGYDTKVLLDAKTGEFQEYDAPDALPPVEFAKPTLTGEDALETAKRLLVNDPPSQQKPWTEFLFSSQPQPWHLEITEHRRLGWYVPTGRTKARLAWAVPYAKVVHKDGISAKWESLMIDAATGARLPGTL